MWSWHQKWVRYMVISDQSEWRLDRGLLSIKSGRGGSGWQLNLGELMPNNFHIFSMQRRIPIKKIQLHFLIIQIYLFIYSESFLNIRHFWKQVVYTYKIRWLCIQRNRDNEHSDIVLNIDDSKKEMFPKKFLSMVNIMTFIRYSLFAPWK